jgi:hypothetical protein
MPAHLSNAGYSILLASAVARELPDLMRYTSPWKVLGRYCLARLLPWQRNRTLLLHALAPGWAQGQLPEQYRQRLGPNLGWEPRNCPEHLDPAEKHRRWAVSRTDYEPSLKQFCIKKEVSQPVDDLVTYCRQEHIELVLVLTPESTAFRGWYGPQAEEQIRVFCAELTRKQGVPVVDARDWLPDEQFMDGHHVMRSGAETFTRRLETEVLRPLVNGRDDLAQAASAARFAHNR